MDRRVNGHVYLRIRGRGGLFFFFAARTMGNLASFAAKFAIAISISSEGNNARGAEAIESPRARLINRQVRSLNGISAKRNTRDNNGACSCAPVKGPVRINRTKCREVTNLRLAEVAA